MSHRKTIELPPISTLLRQFCPNAMRPVDSVPAPFSVHSMLATSALALAYTLSQSAPAHAVHAVHPVHIPIGPTDPSDLSDPLTSTVGGGCSSGGGSSSASSSVSSASIAASGSCGPCGSVSSFACKSVTATSTLPTTSITAGTLSATASATASAAAASAVSTISRCQANGAATAATAATQIIKPGSDILGASASASAAALSALTALTASASTSTNWTTPSNLDKQQPRQPQATYNRNHITRLQPPSSTTTPPLTVHPIKISNAPTGTIKNNILDLSHLPIRLAVENASTTLAPTNHEETQPHDSQGHYQSQIKVPSSHTNSFSSSSSSTTTYKDGHQPPIHSVETREVVETLCNFHILVNESEQMKKNSCSPSSANSLTSCDYDDDIDYIINDDDNAINASSVANSDISSIRYFSPTLHHHNVATTTPPKQTIKKHVHIKTAADITSAITKASVRSSVVSEIPSVSDGAIVRASVIATSDRTDEQINKHTATTSVTACNTTTGIVSSAAPTRRSFVQPKRLSGGATASAAAAAAAGEKETQLITPNNKRKSLTSFSGRSGSGGGGSVGGVRRAFYMHDPAGTAVGGVGGVCTAISSASTGSGGSGATGGINGPPYLKRTKFDHPKMMQQQQQPIQPVQPITSMASMHHGLQSMQDIPPVPAAAIAAARTLQLKTALFDRNRLHSEVLNTLHSNELSLTEFLMFHRITLDEICINFLTCLQYENKFLVNDIMLHWLGYSGSILFQRQVFMNELTMFGIHYEDIWDGTTNSLLIRVNPHDLNFLIINCIGRRYPELSYTVNQLNQINLYYTTYKCNVKRNQLSESQKMCMELNQTVEALQKDRQHLLQDLAEYSRRTQEYYNQYVGVVHSEMQYRQKFVKSEKHVARLLADLYNNNSTTPCTTKTLPPTLNTTITTNTTTTPPKHSQQPVPSVHPVHPVHPVPAHQIPFHVSSTFSSSAAPALSSASTSASAVTQHGSQYPSQQQQQTGEHGHHPQPAHLAHLQTSTAGQCPATTATPGPSAAAAATDARATANRSVIASVPDVVGSQNWVN